jgi:hypothetical protein
MTRYMKAVPLPLRVERTHTGNPIRLPQKICGTLYSCI